MKARALLVVAALVASLDQATLKGGFYDAAVGAALPSRPQTAAEPRAHDEVTVIDTIPFEDGEPASVFWEPRNSTLYIADNENNQIWTWTDAGGLKKAATLPDPDNALAAKATLVGQLVRLADGTVVTMRFGKPGGAFGGIAYVKAPGGHAGTVPGLDPNRKRIGLAVSPAGELFGSYFVSHGGGKQGGAVTRIDLARGETDFAPGFQKITGIVATTDTLIVADQLADTIYELPLNGPLPAPSAYKVRAKLPRPDQLTAGPDGSVFTGQFQAAPGSSASLAVRQVMRDGSVRMVAGDPHVTRPSGVAYDPKGKRLFVANGGNPANCYVRVFAVE